MATVPKDWRIANVMLILQKKTKNRKRRDPGNYRLAILTYVPVGW